MPVQKRKRGEEEEEEEKEDKEEEEEKEKKENKRIRRGGSRWNRGGRHVENVSQPPCSLVHQCHLYNHF